MVLNVPLRFLNMVMKSLIGFWIVLLMSTSMLTRQERHHAECNKIVKRPSFYLKQAWLHNKNTSLAAPGALAHHLQHVPPSKSKMAARGLKNGRQGLERPLSQNKFLARATSLYISRIVPCLPACCVTNFLGTSRDVVRCRTVQLNWFW